jgi:hypothetical protein
LRYDSNDHVFGATCDLLARILQKQGKLGDETLELYKRALAVPLRNQGPDGTSTSVGNQNLAGFYHILARLQLTIKLKRKYLYLSKSHFEEAVRINLKLYGPTHQNTIDVTNSLENVICNLNCPCGIGMCHFDGHFIPPSLG